MQMSIVDRDRVFPLCVKYILFLCEQYEKSAPHSSRLTRVLSPGPPTEKTPVTGGVYVVRKHVGPDGWTNGRQMQVPCAFQFREDPQGMSDELFKLARTTMSVTTYEREQEATESVKLFSVQHIKGQMKERSEGISCMR